MLNLVMKSTEAYTAQDRIVHIGQEELDFLSRAMLLSPRRRTRICTHRSIDERLHEMFVIYSKATYVRPNKHLGKDESVFVIRGEADFVFFDDHGNVSRVIPLGDTASDRAYYCRVPSGVFHTIIIRSEEIVLFEGTPGPFNPAETIYAQWAPPEADEAAVACYIGRLKADLARRPSSRGSTLIGMDKLNKKVLVATDRVAPLSWRENHFLSEQRRREGLDRLRICVHETPEDRLHEMLMVFSGTTYIRPSLHVDKDESLFVVGGLATYFLFDHGGTKKEAVRLGPLGSGRSFYCRIPANTYHSLVVESEEVLVKETTTGPFRPADTHFASWSPDCLDADAAEEYVRSLRSST